MNTIEARPMPPAGHVLGEALRRLPGDKMFWSYVGPTVLLLAALAAFFPRQQTPVSAILFCFLLDHWFKRMLIPDWKERASAKPKSMRQSWAFFGFCLLYGLGLGILPLAFAFATGLTPRSFTVFGGLLMLVVSQAISMIVLALIIGSTLLFLPARAVGLAWNVGDAVRSAAGARGTLMAVALTCTAISIGGTILGFAAMLGWVAGNLPDDLWVTFIGRAIIVFTDMLALYVLVYSLSRLFVARTGWSPPPLPSDRIEPSLTA